MYLQIQSQLLPVTFLQGSKMIKKIAAALITGLLCLPLSFADYNRFGIPDSSEIRKEIKTEWFDQDLEAIQMNNIQIHENFTGEKFQVSLEQDDEKFLIYVSPRVAQKVEVHEAGKVKVIEEDSYPINAYGTWLYARKKSDGKPLFVRYYVSKNSDVFIEFRPNKNVTVADFIIFNSFAVQSIPVGIPFEKLLTASINDIYMLTRKSLPWKYIDSQSFDSTDKQYMEQVLEAMANNIAIEERAMYDERGRLIDLYEGTPYTPKEENKNKIVLSSCGYVKWIVDGLVDPLASSYLKRGPLIKSTVEYSDLGLQGTLNLDHSTYLSLDWTRNLAAAALSVRSKKTYLYKDAGVDVTIEPFTSVYTKQGFKNTAGYIANSGYQPEYLNSILYVLAMTEPEYFYLAAIRQTDKRVSPEMKVFNDAAVIIPYVDANGIFHANVFFEGKKYSWKQFEKYLVNAKDCFVHLTRVKASKVFYPQGYEVKKSAAVEND